nr:acylneuraminate cytidylyltransferase family protein [Gramella jeungdoensis]
MDSKGNIAIIPARGGSKRLPGKNIMKLGNIPLIGHSINYALANSTIIDKIIVSTDDIKIKEVALSYGVEVVDRPTKFSGDKSPTLEAVKHVLDTEKTLWKNVILLQPTNPLRPEILLSKAYDKFISGDFKSLFTVSKTCRKFGIIEKESFKPYNYKFGERSQDIEKLYFENGLLYITKTSLIQQNILIDEHAFPFEISHSFANVDIDTKEDFEYAEYLYGKYNGS